MKDIESIEDLSVDVENINAGTERGAGIIEQSLQRLGAGRSICVDKNGRTIAGNNVLQKAVELGFDIEVVHTNGTRLVVVVRDDLDLEKDARARELSIADNRASEVGLSWRMQKLEEMRLRYADLKTDYLFSATEIRNRLAQGLSAAIQAQQSEKKPTTCPRCGEVF